MKYKIFLLLLMPVMCNADVVTCKDVRQGLFKIHALYGSLNTITRTNEKQKETLGKSGTVFEYDIQWTSDCTYLLFNAKTLRGNDSLLPVSNLDTIYNEIVEVNNYWHKVISILNNCEPKTEISYFNVDTANTYLDLDEIKKFNDYHGKTSGGTLVGYNYAVAFKEHSTDTNNYIIAFLEALIIKDKSRFKLLGEVYCKLDSNQKIVASNCRFNGKFDKEIVAIYSSTNPKVEAVIISAWRFNKLTLRITEVPVEKVKFKEEDKKLHQWED